MIKPGCLIGTVFVLVFAGAGAARAADPAYKGTPDAKWRTVKLSDKGSDRATAYSMTNKIVQMGDRLFVVWLDVVNQTHWTLVDAGQGEIVKQGTVGGTLDDNHCGPAAWMDAGGDIFVLTGAHWRKLPLHLYKARVNGSDVAIEDLGAVSRGTYPSMVVDRDDTLHLAFRGDIGQRWGVYDGVSYARWPKKAQGGPMTPAPLVRRDPQTKGYQYWTNGLALGPNGVLHMAFLNKNWSTGREIYGASHVYSEDGGHSWQQYGRGPISAASEVQTLDMFCTGEHAGGARRFEFQNEEHQNLSVPVVDDRGLPWVVFANLARREGHLYHYDGKQWLSYPLSGMVERVFPDFGVHAQSALSRHRDGTLEVLLNTGPKSIESGKGSIYGHSGCEIVRILLNPDTLEAWADKIVPPDPKVPKVANWMPSIQQWSPARPFERPAMMYMHGNNYESIVGKNSPGNPDYPTVVYLQVPACGAEGP